MYRLSLSNRITPRTITAPFHTNSSVNPHAQSGTRMLCGNGAAEYAAPMWSVMFVKARDAGFIAMIRLSATYRMMVASSTYSAARLPMSRAFTKLRISGFCSYCFEGLVPMILC